MMDIWVRPIDAIEADSFRFVEHEKTPKKTDVEKETAKLLAKSKDGDEPEIVVIKTNSHPKSSLFLVTPTKVTISFSGALNNDHIF